MTIKIKLTYIEKITPLIKRIIKKELIEYFRLNLNMESIPKWNRYLKYFGINYSLSWVLSKIIETLEFNTYNNNEVIIRINKNIKINGYNLDSIARLVEYGNTEIKGIRVISDSFKYIEKNIDDIIYREVA